MTKIKKTLGKCNKIAAEFLTFSLSTSYNHSHHPTRGGKQTGDRTEKECEDVTALRCSEPLRSKVGGPSKVCAILCGMGPP